MDYTYRIELCKNESLAAEDSLVQGYLRTNNLAPWCEEVLQKFSFVKWDRFICTKSPSGPHLVTCYGWIDREKDNYKDFVVISLVLDTKKVVFSISSSVEYNDRISELCARESGFDKSMQKQCVRVESVFSVPNMIKLEK